MNAEELLKYFTEISQGNKTSTQVIRFLIQARGNKEVEKIFKNISSQSDITQERVAAMNDAINALGTGTTNKKAAPEQLTTSRVLNRILKSKATIENDDAYNEVVEAWETLSAKGSSKVRETNLVHAMASYANTLDDDSFPYDMFSFGDELKKWKPQKSGVPHLESLKKDYQNRLQSIISAFQVLDNDEFRELLQSLQTILDPIDFNLFEENKKYGDVYEPEQLKSLQSFIDKFKASQKGSNEYFQLLEDIFTLDPGLNKVETMFDNYDTFIQNIESGIKYGDFEHIINKGSEQQASSARSSLKQKLTDEAKQILEAQIKALQFTDEDLNIDAYFSDLTKTLAKNPMESRGEKVNTKTKLQGVIESLNKEQDNLLKSLSFANDSQDVDAINKIALQYQKNQKAIEKANQMINDWERYPEQKAAERTQREAEKQAQKEQREAEKRARQAEKLAEASARRAELEAERKQKQAEQDAKLKAQAEAQAKIDAEAKANQRALDNSSVNQMLGSSPEIPKTSGAEVIDSIIAKKEKETSARRDNAEAAKEEQKATQQANSTQPQTAWADTLLTKLEQIHEILRDLVGTFQQLNTAFGAVDEKNGITNLLSQLRGISEALGTGLEEKLRHVNVQMSQIVNVKGSSGAINPINALIRQSSNELDNLNSSFADYVNMQRALKAQQLGLKSGALLPGQGEYGEYIQDIWMRDTAPSKYEKLKPDEKLDLQKKHFNLLAKSAKDAGIEFTEFEKRYSSIISKLNVDTKAEAEKPIKEIENVLNPQKSNGLEAYVSQLDQIIDRLQTIANLVSTSMGLGQIFGKDEHGNTTKKDVDYSKVTVPEVKTDAKNESSQFGDLEAKLQNIVELLGNKNRLLQDEFDLVSTRLGGETSAFQPLIDQLQTIDRLLASIVPNLQEFVNSQDAIGKATAINNNQQTGNTNNSQSNSRSSGNSKSIFGARNNNNNNASKWDLSLKSQKRTDKDKNIDAYNDVKTALDKVIAATKTLRTLEAEQKSGKNPWRDYAAEIQLAEKALSSYNTDLERTMQQRYGWQNTADSQAVLTQISAEDRLSQNQKRRLSSLVETKDSETTNLNQSRLDVLIPKWDGLSKAVNNYLKAISNVNKASDVKGMTSLAHDIDNAKQGFDDIFTVLEKRYPHLQATLNSIRQTVSQELNDQMNSASGNILESLQSRNLNIQNVLGNSVNGQLKMGSFGPEIANLQNLDLQIKKLTDDLNQGKISWSTYLSGIQNINSQIAPMEKAGGIIANIQKQIESYGNDQRSMGWSDRMKQISAAMRELFDVRGDAKQFEQKRVALLDMMKGLKAYSNATLMQNKQGFLVGEGTINQISDMEASMRKFAEATNIGSVASVKWSADNQKVTMTCKKASGQITTLTGSMEKLANAYRLTTNVSKAPSAFLTGFTGSIGQTIKQLPRLIMGYDAVMKVRSELTAGMSTFKEYDSTLTNISYTMNMTSKELDALGKSAIDMAKDLSMSVANAEDVYKIYANMNTSAEEIQQLAKPTVILSNLSGVDASTAADEVQGIIQQFDMLKDSEADAADVSMHVVDVLNDISANVAMDYSFN